MRVVLRYLIVAGFFFVLGFMYEYHMPKLESWMIVKIENYSSEKLPARIFPSSVTITLWPLGIKFDTIRILPKGPLAKKIAPVRIQSFGVSLRPQSLLTGDFKLSEIVIRKPELTLIVNPEAETTGKKKLEIKLQDILGIPIQEVRIEDAVFQVRSSEAELLSRAEGLNLHFENQNQMLYVEIEAPKIHVKRNAENSKPMIGSLDGSALISEREILIRGIKVNEGESFVIASGNIKGDIEDQKFTDIALKARTHLEIKSALDTLQSLYKKMNLPRITGFLDSEFVYAKSDTTPESIKSVFETDSLHVAQFKIGKTKGQAELLNNHLSVKHLAILNSAGQIKIEDAELDLKDDMKYKARVSVNDLELKQLLLNLDVGDTPLHLLINGTLPCEGQVKPEFTNACTGKITLKDFWVKSPNGKNIAAFNDANLDGQVSVSMKAVTAKAKIQLGTSEGEAQAVIDYEKGFDISYSTPQLDFKNIRELAGLKVEGKGAITGTTTGTGKSAKFGFKLKGQDIWFEDYGLSQATADVAYSSGSLTFKNIEGLMNTTRYFASVYVDLEKDRIKADGKLGFAEVRDIQNAFSRKFQLPFEIFGNAAAKVSVEGPFQFNQLTYDLDASIFRGTVATESFDEARFHVTANKGNVKTQNVYFKKGLGLATMSGEGYPTGQIDARMSGHGFKLEDLSFFNQTDSPVLGTVNFDMNLKGHVLSPDTEIKGVVTDTVIGKEAVPNSKFEVGLTRKQIYGEARFLDDKVWAEFAFPLDNESSFKLRGKTNKWNFAPLFSLLSKDVVVREFDTEVTMDMDLAAKSGGFWNSTGKVQIPTLRIRRGNLELYNPQIPVLAFENGRMDIRNFLLQGDNTFLKIEAENSTKNDFNVSMNGKIEMSLLAFLTPFFSDLKGVLSIAGQLDGNASQPKLIGSAFIEKGYAKLKELVHPFENIKADFLFNQQKIVVNSIQTTFAGGTAYADGFVEVKGFRKFPTELKGRFEKVNMTVPKDFNTQGSGEFKITGEWFPFLFSGSYDILGGLITMALGDDAQAAAQVKRSSLLPNFLLEQGFSPLKFDLQTRFPSGLYVRNNLIETEIRGQIKIMGTPTDPILLGEVVTPPGGKLMFRDVPFEIQSANMKFNNPTKINPTLYASANSRIQDYDVSLLLQGTRENYQIILRSTPPLPEQDIISLLALGYTPKQLEQVKSDQQIDQQSYEIGGAILSNNPLGNEIKNKYGISVRFGSAVDDATKTVAPKVIVEKQWSKKFGTSASRTVGNVVTQDVKAEYKLNTNVSVIGSWEGKEYAEENKSSQTETKNTDILGLDLQYRQEFK